MDKLSSLPENPDTVQTDEEKEVIQSYFSKDNNKTILKSLLYPTIAFAVLANPFIDDLIKKIPNYGTNAILVFISKIIIFVILLFIIDKFL